MSEITEIIATQGLVQIGIIMIIAMILLAIVRNLNRGSKSYRSLMVDMYVVGTVKNLATKDGIDLVKELNEYSRIIKRNDLSEKGLAKVIEDELKEKVADVQEKSLNQ